MIYRSVFLCHTYSLCNPYENTSTKRDHAWPPSLKHPTSFPHMFHPRAHEITSDPNGYPSVCRRISSGCWGGVDNVVHRGDTWSLIAGHELFRLAEQMFRPRTELQTPALIVNAIHRAKDALYHCSEQTQSSFASSVGRTVNCWRAILLSITGMVKT